MVCLIAPERCVTQYACLLEHSTPVFEIVVAMTMLEEGQLAQIAWDSSAMVSDVLVVQAVFAKCGVASG